MKRRGKNVAKQKGFCCEGKKKGTALHKAGFALIGIRREQARMNSEYDKCVNGCLRVLSIFGDTFSCSREKVVF